MKKKLLISVLIIIVALSLGLGLTACDKKATDKSLRMVMPDGTPALSVARLFSSDSLGGKTMDMEIIAAAGISAEMGTGRADIVIMPTNGGANLIVNKRVDYKLVSVNVLGSLYIVGPDADGTISPDELKGKKIGSIGEGQTPDIVFRKIIAGTDGINYGDFTLNFYAEAPMVKQALAKGEIDYALVGEPAATAFSAGAQGYGRMDLQYYWKQVTGFDNYPQASMFVKTSLNQDKDFMDALLSAVAGSAEWVGLNKATVTEYLRGYGSTSAFPPASIDRCNVTMLRAAENKEMISAFMSAVIGSEWSHDEIFY